MERESSVLPCIAEVCAGELHPDLDTAEPEGAQLMDQNESKVN